MVDRFLLLVVEHGLPRPETEVLFARPRRWRADYCWPAAKVISNAAQLRGYLFLRYTPRELDSGAVLPELRRALESKAGIVSDRRH